MKSCNTILIVFALLIAAVLRVQAQTTFASITGAITDASGAGVAGAQVSAVHRDSKLPVHRRVQCCWRDHFRRRRTTFGLGGAARFPHESASGLVGDPGPVSCHDFNLVAGEVL
jgi:hypothetical protein